MTHSVTRYPEFHGPELASVQKPFKRFNMGRPKRRLLESILIFAEWGRESVQIQTWITLKRSEEF